MKLLSVLSIILVLGEARANETFEVRVERVDSASGHSADFEWEFTSEYGTRLDFVCPMNDFAYGDKPHIIYFGNENQYVGRFNLDAGKKCNDLNEYLRGVTYKIDPNHPIIIKFNRKTKEIDSMSFPELDPYELGTKKEVLL
jgi:hypothetical protein